jgi:3-oxoacyl-(acyl-carrier-protein) synthase
MTQVYINGTGVLSAQKTLGISGFPTEIVSGDSTMMKIVEPNYREFVSGDLVRRMSRLIKMGISASRVCLQDAGCSMPDGIITGTGLGCIEDTEKFLANMIGNSEEFLTPTSFIQSTHNTVGAQIALLLKCHHYNFTYVHRGFSFESALLDALLQIDENRDLNLLVGGVDELTKNSFEITRRLGLWRTKPVNNLDLLKGNVRGTLAGEGATFFLLSGNRTEKSLATISGLKLLFKPQNSAAVVSEALRLLEENGLTPDSLDLIVLGLNGDASGDRHYRDFAASFPTVSTACFKHLSGEYFTASAFGLWLSSVILRQESVPDVVKVAGTFNKPPANILLYNHFQNLDHSLILLRDAR